ncbi:DUF3048 domain-containing protein [Nostocoides sp. HKS02]|uniref:DUF3048 domain-containing protein n=1 Tax=Nostocoides sp. HKS02 TaxID=1813880 RepID=UPI0012B4E013|nr:DUF3048 domain-containing protein [Tetrasphaera sp. HKS02]QGN56557.1 DUF3048 domain-containing protein [Tetrasphaera sp. HKS02]
MSSRARQTLGGLAVCLTALAVAAGCSGKPAAAPRHPSTTTTPSATPTPSLPGVPLSGGPVLAVKIDNTPAGRPRIGLAQADVVYVEPVEGGLTRLMAVFSRHLPSLVGPVRSGRETDKDLLANYGPVALAYSGASSYTVGVLATGHQVNLVFDYGSRGFYRDHSRPAPYNVIGNTTQLLARAGGGVRPGDIGFRYGAPTTAGTPATSVVASWPSSTEALVWNPARKVYLVTTNRQADVSPTGQQYTASTVVVQYVRTHLTANRDVNGVQTPLAEVIGHGAATVLRDGRVWRGTWSRPSATAPTVFTSAGKRVTFAPTGTVWVLLVAVGQPVTVR